MLLMKVLINRAIVLSHRNFPSIISILASGTIDTIKLHGWETGCAAHALFAGSDVTSSLIL